MVSSASTTGTAVEIEALGAAAFPCPQATPRTREQHNSKIDVLTDVYLALGGKRATG